MTLLNLILSSLKLKIVQKKCMVDMDVVIELLVPAKVLYNVWLYDYPLDNSDVI